MYHRRLIRGDADRVYISVRSAYSYTMNVGMVVVWAFDQTLAAVRSGEAVHPCNFTPTYNGNLWLMAGVVVESSIFGGSNGLIQVYGAVDSVLVDGWDGTTAVTSFPNVFLRPHDVAVTSGASTLGAAAPIAWNATNINYYNGCVLFAASSQLNTSTAGDETVNTTTGFIRGFIRAM